MLKCYLDDSGKDPQNSITTIAGYAATAQQWTAFETDAEPKRSPRDRPARLKG